MKDKEVKKRARANKRDKRRTSERVAEEAKRAVHQNNLIMKELYMKTTLPWRGCLKKPSTGIRTKDGKVIRHRGRGAWKVERAVLWNPECGLWRNRSSWRMPARPLRRIHRDGYVTGSKRRAISRLKSGKVPSVDNISIEMLKARPAIALNLMRMQKGVEKRLLQEQAPPTEEDGKNWKIYGHWYP